MKIIAGILLISSLLIGQVPAEVISSFWQNKKSQHFVVYYQEAPAGFLDELIYKAEDYYNSIVDELGFRRFDFWSWDNRAKIYLYRNSDEFRKDANRANWSGAVVTVANRTIESFIGQSGFFDSILPHEMAHIIFREFVGQKVVLPLWIDEGVACSQERSYLLGRMQFAKNLVLQNKYLKFSKLFEIYQLGSDIQPQTFYSQSASIVVFLIRQYGKESFLDFSRKIRDGVHWQKALLSAFRFNDFNEMEEAWKAFMLKS
ncbi:MAG: peptidase MA family metallohydrolase [Candidatus Omnitrophica bacterium]|nr:peptidase MA family metallohydrolase [Candidatus Omnitrophota bacterium]MDD5661245.1 peptidase MA family metallohydrolase [Candidatus Omnitrophota bacterium]